MIPEKQQISFEDGTLSSCYKQYNKIAEIQKQIKRLLFTIDSHSLFNIVLNKLRWLEKKDTLWDVQNSF